MAAAGLQTIIDNCNGLTIDRRKVVGIQYTRNEIPRISQTPTKNPWRFKLEMPDSFRYSQARELLEAIDTLDAVTPQVITFSNNPKLSWMFAYQGAMTLGQRNQIRVQSFVGDQLVLTNLPVLGATKVLFAPNDLIQIGNYYYPFTSTTQVLRGSAGTVTVTTNRPNILSTVVNGYGITVGNTCKFTMFCPNMPVYKLIVGGALMNGPTVTNNALIQWSDTFNFYEFVGTA